MYLSVYNVVSCYINIYVRTSASPIYAVGSGKLEINLIKICSLGTSLCCGEMRDTIWYLIRSSTFV